MTDDMLTLDQAEAEFGLKRATLYRYVHKGTLTTYGKVGDRKSYVKRDDLIELTRFKPRKKRARTRDA